MKNQKRNGALISYLNIMLGLVSNLLLVPLMIGALSDDEYSIYRVMQSFAGPLMMLNLGISTIAARVVAQYRVDSDQNKETKENTLALALLIACAMAVLALLVSTIMSLFLPAIYGQTYSPELLKKAKQIFFILSVTTAIRVINDTFKGCIQGNEHFLCYYGENTVQYIFRFAAIYMLLKRGSDAVAVSIVDMVLSLLLLVFNFIYTTVWLKERFHLSSVNRAELKTIASFSIAILIQTIINQINSNMDIIILGAVVVHKEIITMYSSALSIYTTYNSMMSVLVNLFFPKAAQLVIQECSGEALTEFVIKPGRIQAIMAVGVLTAFALFGKNFIYIWIGARYEYAYYVALMLMIPVTIPLVENVCLAILDAKLKRMFRSVTLLVMSLINVVVSIILVRHIGFWGATLGTVLSLLIGHGLLMNLYYKNVIGLNIRRMFREIFRGILVSGILSGIVCLPLACLLGNSIGLFVIKCAIFVLAYAVGLWLIGLNHEEKTMIINTIKRKKA